MNPWYVYMVRCSKGALYTGISTDVPHRIEMHNSGKGSKAVKALGLPVKLMFSKLVGSKSQASKIEIKLKRLPKIKKEEMIKLWSM